MESINFWFVLSNDMSKPVTENLTIVQGETFDRSIRLCSYLRSVNDGNIAAGSDVLTSNCGGFSSLDVGRRVLVNGAGPGGGILDSIIASVESATSVTLVNLATAPASKTLVSIYTPVALTGWDISSQIRDDENGGNLLADFDITIDAPAGRVTRSLDAAVSAGLPASKAWHDFRMVDAGPQVRVYTRGRLTILPRITE